jgi:hypothetical protein
MTEEDIEALAIEHADNKSLSGTHIWVVSKLSFMDGYKAASKEEVSWDEALGKFKETDKYMPYSTSVTMANYINWLKQNYTLIPKTK